MRFVREAFESNYIAPLGPMVDAFEKKFAEYVGIKHCLALSSGTAAMHLALRILGVGLAPSGMRFAVTCGEFHKAVCDCFDTDFHWECDADCVSGRNTGFCGFGQERTQ